MTHTIRGRLNETRNRIEDTSASIRSGITQRRDEIVERGRRLRTDLHRKRDVTMGKLKDTSLDRLYGVSEQALLRVATVVETAGRVSRVKAFDKPVSTLREHAEQLEDARGGLLRPDIEDYDSLNVKKVNAALADLSPYQLEKIRGYEEANKGRVTVLREIDRLLTN